MEKVVPEFVCDRSETIESNLQKLVEFLSNAPEFAEGEAIAEHLVIMKLGKATLGSVL